jgi:hypothetical protein
MEMQKDKIYSTSSDHWNNTNNNNNSNCGSNDSSRKSYNYYAYLEEQINNKAKKLTIDYIKSQGG